jgi:hypothetical protein
MRAKERIFTYLVKHTENASACVPVLILEIEINI